VKNIILFFATAKNYRAIVELTQVANYQVTRLAKYT